MKITNEIKDTELCKNVNYLKELLGQMWECLMSKTGNRMTTNIICENAGLKRKLHIHVTSALV